MLERVRNTRTTYYDPASKSSNWRKKPSWIDDSSISVFFRLQRYFLSFFFPASSLSTLCVTQCLSLKGWTIYLFTIISSIYHQLFDQLVSSLGKDVVIVRPAAIRRACCSLFSLSFHRSFLSLSFWLLSLSSSSYSLARLGFLALSKRFRCRRPESVNLFIYRERGRRGRRTSKREDRTLYIESSCWRMADLIRLLAWNERSPVPPLVEILS